VTLLVNTLGREAIDDRVVQQLQDNNIIGVMLTSELKEDAWAELNIHWKAHYYRKLAKKLIAFQRDGVPESLLSPVAVS
jgi:intracellular septation protein A